ncbi:gag protease polyprotein [Cucumis melo var. makuwa]|uniref:Gag protease polyprotein n=1 Tax=Cucumis melo var. makuwa TaxID=1194695 RepID=A0A5A7VED9_CUCMM|nr:gag protease polyprotein [Cucumis melo var. makuwa]TYK01428.1 gag protease polyprotein [Cucumis melo var. makuwa]
MNSVVDWVCSATGRLHSGDVGNRRAALISGIVLTNNVGVIQAPIFRVFFDGQSRPTSQRRCGQSTGSINFEYRVDEWRRHDSGTDLSGCSLTGSVGLQATVDGQRRCFVGRATGFNSQFREHLLKLLETTSNQTPTSQQGRVFIVTRQEVEQAGTVVTGIDWLSVNHTSIDCSRKEVVFNPLSAGSFKFTGAETVVLPKVISAMKAGKLLNQGTWSILTSVVDIREPKVSLSAEPMVREYPNVGE